MDMPEPSSHVRFRVGKQLRVRMPRRRYEILRTFDLRMKHKIDDDGLLFMLADMEFTDKEIERGSKEYMKLMMMYYKKKMNRTLRKNKRDRFFFFKYHFLWWLLFGYMAIVAKIFESSELRFIALIWLWSLVMADIINAWKSWREIKKLDKKLKVVGMDE